MERPNNRTSTSGNTSRLFQGKPCTAEASPRPGCSTLGPQFPASSTVTDDDIIDLTDGPSDLLAEVPSRWNCFQTGTIDVPLVRSYEAPSVVTTNGAEDDFRQYNHSGRMVTSGDQRSRNDYRGQQQQVVETYRPLPRHDDTPPIMAFSLESDSFQLPLEPYDKPRRVLRTHDSSVITVTMYGFIETVQEINTSKRRQPLASPDLLSEEHIDDACLLSGHETTALVLAHAREDVQLMYLPMKGFRVSNMCTQCDVFPNEY